MSEINTGGPAFPIGPQGCVHTGLSLRDYFAAKAMAAYINAIVISFMNDKCEKTGCDERMVAQVAYQYADEMIKARQS
jgi:hypothetical protein